MPVTFNDANSDRIPAPWREEYQSIIRQAIDTSRPITEHWTVTTHETPTSTVVTFDFARGAETAQSLTLAMEDGDAHHTDLYRTVCQFLRVTWTGEIKPS
jgi:hypothetical protein